MCGIFGFFSKNRTIKRQDILVSLEALRHRGPDNAGVVCFDSQNPSASPFVKGRPHIPHFEKGGQGGILKESTNRYFPANSLPDGEWSSVMAHARLSIIDLSDAGNQPMCNEVGTVWITYNGEIYNFQELREELLVKGHKFKSRSDTEVIIHGYEEWGINVVDRLRGMFAFALLDQRNNAIFLVRDRFGVKPLKYSYDGETLVFASELKGIMNLVPRRMDTAAVNSFLTLKYIVSPHTILEGVEKLQPATFLKLDMNTGKVSTETYWRPAFYPKQSVSFSEAKERFRELLSESVFMRTVSDVPIGVYLSGGMDSSAMVALLKERGVENISTFTIKFDRPGYDESKYARIVADRFQTRHHEFQTPELSYPDLQDIINSLDEPFGDPSYIPTWFLSKFTSGHVKVILSGDGGDELLGGYKRYYIHARGRALSLLPRMQCDLFRKLPPDINKRTLTGRLQRIEESLAAGYWGSYFNRFNGLSDTFKRYVMTPEFYKTIEGLSPGSFLFPHVEKGGQGGIFNSDFKNISNTIERLLWIDMQTYLPDYILTKTDLALMAHSAEGRNPFVDYRLAEFANTLPPEYKFREGGKYILRKVLEDYVPKEVLNRKKMGFSPPIKYWFRDNLGLLYDIFSEGDFVSGDIFDLKRIHEAIEKFKTPDVNISEQLWLIMVLELWRRKAQVNP